MGQQGRGCLWPSVLKAEGHMATERVQTPERTLLNSSRAQHLPNLVSSEAKPRHPLID